MRRPNLPDQLPLMRPFIAHPHAAELSVVGAMLTANPRLTKRVAQDLLRGVVAPRRGAPGMSATQVLGCLLVKQMHGFSYEELAFHVEDSGTFRSFCGFGALDPTPGRSTLAENIKKISAATLERINRRVIRYAVQEGIEPGKKVRIDSTVTETNIHPPTDSTLLWDGVRVVTRLLRDAQQVTGFAAWTDHTKRAKRRMLRIANTGDAAVRVDAYVDLLKVAHKCAHYATAAERVLRAHAQPAATVVADQLDDLLTWVWCVMDQTERRVLRGESVPAEQKVVSLFESHTDIIVKARRETLYGHKIFLSAGASGLITDCVITEGNPADSTMTLPLLRRQRRILGHLPKQAALDGGFASAANLVEGKALGLVDLAFSKGRGLAVSDMARSTWIYRGLRNFRAGVEGLISFLKRACGLDRCTWKGETSFNSYVQSSVLAGNLLTLARHRLA